MKIFYISSSYAKILEETNFQPQNFPRSGSKAKDVEEEEERKTESWAPGPKSQFSHSYSLDTVDNSNIWRIFRKTFLVLQ